MRFALFLPFLFLSILARPSLAHAQGDAACFEQEIDPATNRRYHDESAYRADLEALISAEPVRPSYFTLYRAYQLTKAETANARAMKSDKRAHCYMGCRIANDFGTAAAEYAAWYKEHQDLTDCNPGSRFEPRDIEATRIGIRLGEAHAPAADLKFCQARCRQQIR